MLAAMSVMCHWHCQYSVCSPPSLVYSHSAKEKFSVLSITAPQSNTFFCSFFYYTSFPKRLFDLSAVYLAEGWIFRSLIEGMHHKITVYDASLWHEWATRKYYLKTRGWCPTSLRAPFGSVIYSSSKAGEIPLPPTALRVIFSLP